MLVEGKAVMRLIYHDSCGLALPLIHGHVIIVLSLWSPDLLSEVLGRLVRSSGGRDRIGQCLYVVEDTCEIDPSYCDDCPGQQRYKPDVIVPILARRCWARPDA